VNCILAVWVWLVWTGLEKGKVSMYNVNVNAKKATSAIKEWKSCVEENE
jgi:hypothetical protein